MHIPRVQSPEPYLYPTTQYDDAVRYSPQLSQASSPPQYREKALPPPPPGHSGAEFWLIFVALMVSTFLSAIDLTSVSTALPTIVQELNGTEFVWVGSAFTLGQTAVMPLIGSLGQIFGRRPVVLASLFFFALGSAACGAANGMTMLVLGRGVQGIGAGGINVMTVIVVADLVPLSKRGTYMGLIVGVWAVASAIGPPLGGAFSQSNWRWLFYLNLPLTAISAGLVWRFLRLRVPQDDLRSKLRRMDWVGNALIIVGTTLSVIALTWAGVKYPWTSWQVFIPLIFGVEAIIGFLVYEAKGAVEPVVPWELVSNRNSALGYATVFLHGLITTVVLYYLPVYFQTALLQGPVASGVSIFGNAFTVAPGAIVAGFAVSYFGVYLPQNWVGWAFTTLGIGLLSLLKAGTPQSHTVSHLGVLPVSKSAQALALLSFVRSYSETWSVTVGASILQNQLEMKLPEEFVDWFHAVAGVEIAFAAIPRIGEVPEPVQTAVREAFAASLRPIWLAMTVLSGLGLLCSLGMKELRMHDTTNDESGLLENRDEQENSLSVETDLEDSSRDRGYSYTHLSISPIQHH